MQEDSTINSNTIGSGTINLHHSIQTVKSTQNYPLDGLHKNGGNHYASVPSQQHVPDDFWGISMSQNFNPNLNYFNQNSNNSGISQNGGIEKNPYLHFYKDDPNIFQNSDQIGASEEGHSNENGNDENDHFSEQIDNGVNDNNHQSQQIDDWPENDQNSQMGSKGALIEEAVVEQHSNIFEENQIEEQIIEIEEQIIEIEGQTMEIEEQSESLSQTQYDYYSFEEEQQ